MSSAKRSRRLLSFLFLCGLLALLGLILAGSAPRASNAAGKPGVAPQRPVKRAKRSARAKKARPVVRATPAAEMTTSPNHWRLNQTVDGDQAPTWPAFGQGGVRHGERAGADDPDKAAEHFLLKRLPEGETDLPVERYLEAHEQKQLMPQYSTADGGRFAASRAELRNSAEQPHLGAWTWLGPGNIGGRTRAIVINPQNPNVMFAGGVSGGVWKSVDAGVSWTPVSDLIANVSIGALAMDPTDPNVLYAGTGEGYFLGPLNTGRVGTGATGFIRGLGIFKSTDAGANWTRLPGTDNSNFFYIHDLVVSPINNQRIYAATETGVWRSLDGGMSWALAFNALVSGQPIRGGCLDLAIRAEQGADVVFASFGTVAQASIYRSTNAGADGAWTLVLSDVGMGRTALAIAPSNPSVIYAVATAFTGQFTDSLHAVFRSTSGGAPGTWQPRVRNTDANKLNRAILSSSLFATQTDCRLGASDSLFGQGFYDLAIGVDPADENRVWVGGIEWFRSDDGGANWGVAGFGYTPGSSFGPVHPDQHTITFHPQYNGTTNQTLYVGNDGGLYRTDNARATTATGPTGGCDPANTAVRWTPVNNNYGVTQFYHGAVAPDGKTYFGGTQDNGTVRGTDAGGPNNWEMILGADGGFSLIDFINPQTFYVSTQGTNFWKSTDGGATFSFGRFGVTEGGLFITPLAMDPSEPARIYTGSRSLFRTNNGMSSWGPFVLPPAAGTLSALAVAPTDSNFLLAGFGDGTIFRTDRALNLTTSVTLAAPNEVTARPRAGYVSSFAFDPNNKNIAYATYSTFNSGTSVGHVFRTTDGARTWTRIDGAGATALPDVPTHVVAVDPANPARLYVGTDVGVFVSVDGGATWAVENTGFANAITEALELRIVDGATHLFAFTHGRGLFKVTANTGGCNYAITPTTRSFGRVGGDALINITAAPTTGCGWRAESNASWIELVSADSGTGNGTVSLRVAANNTLGNRAGTVTVAGRSFTITQDGLPDEVAPTLTITIPTQTNINTTAGVINLVGTATDNVRVVAVTYRTDRGVTGTASGTTSWTIAGLPLVTGRNVITVTARDEAGNTSGAQTIIVTSTPASVLQTIAGNGATGFNGNNIPALLANMGQSARIAYDGGGNLYVAEFNTHRVRRIAPDGRITTVAGTGAFGFSGDGGAATQARLDTPVAVAVDKGGNVYISDYFNNRIRRVDAASGVITTYVGTGASGFSGDDGPANQAMINGPEGLAVDNDGNLYLADSLNNRLRRVSASDGKIATSAGTNTAGFSGDGGPARNAQLRNPLNVFVDGANNIYLADAGNFRLRRISAGDGVISTVAGNGSSSFSGDGGPATAAGISNIIQFTLDQAGNIYLADSNNLRIRRVAADSGVITTIAGGASGFTPDGGAAIGARLGSPYAIAVDPAGSVVFGDRTNVRLRRIVPSVTGDVAPPTVQITLPTAGGMLNTASNPIELRGAASDNNTIATVRWSNDRGGSGQALGYNTWVIPAVGLALGINNVTVTAWDVSGNAGSARLTVNYTAAQVLVTLAGTGANAPSADGGPGLAASLSLPIGVVVDRQGNVIFADSTNRRVRKISPAGVITAFAGTGELGSSGDGGPATAATMNLPRGLAIDAAGNVYLADTNVHNVRKVSVDGRITTIAGRRGGFGGYGGDGGPATEALFSNPQGIAVDAQSNVYIADSGNRRIRKINASDGKITTVAGSGSFGSGGDDGPATSAELQVPTGVAVDIAGNLYIADQGAHRIRRVDHSDGKMTTVAGTGIAGYNGDGIAGPEAQLNFTSFTTMLSFDPAGDLIIADSGNHRIRKLAIVSRIITTIAGTGVAGFGGENTAAMGASLLFPTAAVVDAQGNLYIADTNNQRIRRTRPAGDLRTVATVSAASFLGELAGDAIATAFGANLAMATQLATSLPLPTTMAGTTVRVRDNPGTERLAPLFFVAPTQINFLVPNGTAPGLASVIVTNSNGQIATNTINIGTVAPGLFAANANGQGVASAVVFRRNAAGQDSFEPVVRFDAAMGRFVAVPIDLGPAGDQVFLIAYGTGFRHRSSLANVAATIGDVNAPVIYAGLAPDFIGLDQANLRIDRSLTGRGDVEVRLTMDGKTANVVRINIK